MGKKIGQKVPKNAKKSQNTFFLIGKVRKLLAQSKNVTVRSYHKLSKDKNGPKKLPKSGQNLQIGKKSPKWQKTPIGPWRHVAKRSHY